MLFLLLSVVVIASATNNPFLVEKWFVNPQYKNEIAPSIANASTDNVKENLNTLSTLPTAFWLDTKAKISGDNNTLESILYEAGSDLVVAVIYDLPNRDCSAEASSGELCCAYEYNNSSACDWTATTCDAGILAYQSEYIDEIVKVLNTFPEASVIFVIEPDALANLATNSKMSRCGNATQQGYKAGISYAVSQFSQLSNVLALYLDAANGAWMGWSSNLQAYASILTQVFPSDQDLTNNVRGFATNVANYQSLGIMCPWESSDGIQNEYCLNGNNNDDTCCSDPCSLLTQYNPANNELNYIASLDFAIRSTFPTYTPNFIIDTGRNGVQDSRIDCSDWCNVRGAGLGTQPTNKTANNSLIDAYLYIKTPGESDGCTEILPDGSECGDRYDSSCSSQDSVGSEQGEPHAPQAGQWFNYHAQLLASNAAWASITPVSPFSLVKEENR